MNEELQQNLRELWPTQQEYNTLQTYAMIRKRLVQNIVDLLGEMYPDVDICNAVDDHGRLGWPFGFLCDGAMSPEIYYACVHALGWDAINKQHVDPYIEQYCSVYNEWMEKLEIVPNAAFLAAELSQAARENGMQIDIGAENGGRAYTEAEQAKIGGVAMEYWEPKGPYGQRYYGRGLGSLTWEEGYRRYDEWCRKEGKPWRPYQDPDVLCRDLECSITSLIWAKYISGGAFGKPDKVIDAHLNAEDKEAFLVVVQCCAGKTKMAEREANGTTRERFEKFLPIINGILGGNDNSKKVNVKRPRYYQNYKNSSYVSTTSLPPINVKASATSNWSAININKGIEAINKGLISNGKFTLAPGCRSKGQCAGGVSRLVAYMSGVGHPACNRYNAAGAYRFMDGKLLEQGRFVEGGPVVPGMAGKWECVGEVKGSGSTPAGYVAKPGDICATDTGRRDGHGYHLEIFLGKGVGRSGWWSDFDQGKPVNYGVPSQVKRFFRKTS